MAEETLGKGLAYAGRPYSRMTHSLCAPLSFLALLLVYLALSQNGLGMERRSNESFKGIESNPIPHTTSLRPTNDPPLPSVNERRDNPARQRSSGL